ncbi:hypothetical protein JJQ59_04845 [Cupriavidus necator]|uniref:Uncharacterized protein n=1 Tax=Cupriavidus necator TaxID=106590 RepID=A0A367P720_CUPNE|nr:hypothetical protein [Cupriavidus necator]QQX85272.1 hypothetical protein JJQ59_04845 [Cupriavidus necator]RCJ03303.1 hypothetical protein DDK22_38040 [Cupriavidus necator]
MISDSLAQLRELLAPVVAKAESAKAEMDAIKADRQTALAPVRALVEQLGVPAALKSLRYLSSRPFLIIEQKDEFRTRCSTLLEANEMLAEKFGLTLPALAVIADSNYNRLDKTKDVLARYADIYAGIRKVD